MKAMHYEPAERYPSAKSLAEDLDRFLRGEPTSATGSGLLDRVAREIRRDQHQTYFEDWGRTLAFIGIVIFVCHTAMFLLRLSELPPWIAFWMPRAIMLCTIFAAIYYARQGSILPRSVAERPVFSIWLGYLLTLGGDECLGSGARRHSGEGLCSCLRPEWVWIPSHVGPCVGWLRPVWAWIFGGRDDRQLLYQRVATLARGHVAGEPLFAGPPLQVCKSRTATGRFLTGNACLGEPRRGRAPFRTQAVLVGESLRARKKRSKAAKVPLGNADRKHPYNTPRSHLLRGEVSWPNRQESWREPIGWLILRPICPELAETDGAEAYNVVPERVFHSIPPASKGIPCNERIQIDQSANVS